MRNLSQFERAWRWFAGTALMTWAFAGGPTWAYLGIYFLATGSWGFCPAYSLLKIKEKSSQTDKA